MSHHSIRTQENYFNPLKGGWCKDANFYKIVNIWLLAIIYVTYRGKKGPPKVARPSSSHVSVCTYTHTRFQTKINSSRSTPLHNIRMRIYISEGDLRRPLGLTNFPPPRERPRFWCSEATAAHEVRWTKKVFFVLEYFILSSEFFFQRDAINFGRSNNNGFSFNRHANGIYENASCAPPCRNSKGLDNRVQILVGCQPATMGKTGNLTLRKEVL